MLKLLTAIIAAICLGISYMSPQASFGDSADASASLEVMQIRLYKYDKNSISNYHFGEPTLPAMMPQGTEIVINGLVNNQNHTGEHFDYITQVIDSEGYTRYIHVRYGVAVPIGRQIGIDSGVPVILDEVGTYIVKIFAWRHLDDNPVTLSAGAARSINVTE
ncbi:MAG: hypothetical protein ACREAY_09410 [Nitrososphaera sp.]